MTAAVTAIIPVRNGAATLARCLTALRSQKLEIGLNIVVLDSASTDGSREIAARFGATVIPVEPGTFNHGATRNLGVQHAQTEFLYFTVQDAFFADDAMLNQMLRHFKNENVAAVNGMQAVEPVAANNPAVWFKRISKPVARQISFQQGKFAELSREDEFAATAWDNVNALYRRSALDTIPFQQTNFAEDRLWAKDALAKGFTLVHDPAVVVFHYHHLSFLYHYNTTLLLHVLYFRKFGLVQNRPSALQYVRRSYYVLKTGNIPLSKKLYWVLHNWLQYVAEVAAAIRFSLTRRISGVKGLQQLAEHFTIHVPQGSIQA